jgi:hypothetical protein
MIYAPWYGIQSGDQTSQFTFLKRSTSSQKIIDFAGRDFSVSFDSESTFALKAKNGKITSTGSGYLMFEGGSSFDNFTFDGQVSFRSISANNFSNCDFLVFTKGDFSSTTPINARFVNCTFSNDVNFSFSDNVKLNGDSMKFVNCSFIGLVSLYSVATTGILGGEESQLHFTNCDFMHDDTATFAKTTFTYSLIHNCYFSNKTYCVLRRNCSLIGSYARATNPGFIAGCVVTLEQTSSSKSEIGINVIGNHLGQIYIDTSEINDPNTLVYGLNISNNFIDVSTAFDGIDIGFVTDLADFGHECVIAKNMPKAGIGDLNSTYGRGSINVNATIDSTKVILPKIESTNAKAQIDNVVVVDSSPP